MQGFGGSPPRRGSLRGLYQIPNLFVQVTFDEHLQAEERETNGERVTLEVKEAESETGG